MSLMQLGPVMFGGVDGIIDFLRHNGLLACNLDCQRYILLRSTSCIASIHGSGAQYQCKIDRDLMFLMGGAHSVKEGKPYERVASLQNLVYHLRSG